MIDELIVRNLGVIESARLEPGRHLTVITGETGTGKTLLLGALRLLLGGAARPDLIGPFGDEAVAQGRFVIAHGIEVGAARRMPRDGRTRAYLDGAIVSAAALEDRVADLVDLVGQNDHLSLTRPSETRAMVDRAPGAEGAAARYREVWKVAQEAHAARASLGGDRPALERELDLVGYQAEEIVRAGFRPGDDDLLQQQADRLRDADKIAAALTMTMAHLESGREAVGEAVAAVRRAARLDATIDRVAESLAGAAGGLEDASLELRHILDHVGEDSGDLDLVEARLTALGELKRKYGRTLEEVLEFGTAAATRRDELIALLDRADRIDQEVSRVDSDLVVSAQALREARRVAGEGLAAAAVAHLADLGFTDPVVEVAMEPTEPGPSGADKIRLLFASDQRLSPGDVATVASGGELSRLVLALRLAGGGGTADTLVFDEVDSGIGGATALALGRKLAELATERQVMCVTHLPQIAAFADRHYVVTRHDTTGTVGLVEGEERIAELARMLAGLPESDRGRAAAAELLRVASGG